MDAEFCTVKQAARITGGDEQLVRRWIKLGVLPAKRVEGRYFIKLAFLYRLLEPEVM